MGILRSTFALAAVAVLGAIAFGQAQPNLAPGDDPIASAWVNGNAQTLLTHGNTKEIAANGFTKKSLQAIWNSIVAPRIKKFTWFGRVISCWDTVPGYIMVAEFGRSANGTTVLLPILETSPGTKKQALIVPTLMWIYRLDLVAEYGRQPTPVEMLKRYARIAVQDAALWKRLGLKSINDLSASAGVSGAVDLTDPSKWARALDDRYENCFGPGVHHGPVIAHPVSPPSRILHRL